jgi:hypothetical protein
VSVDSRPDPKFVKMRETLFGGQLAARLVALDRAAGASEVVVAGVVIEIGEAENTILVYGLRDGTASVYLRSGGGYIGGRDLPRVAAAAKALVAEAGRFVGIVPLAREHPLPAPGMVRISILTSEGVLAAEDVEKRLMAGDGALYPLFLRGNDIVGGYRGAARPPPGEGPRITLEKAYLICLLTAIARGRETSVTLFEGSSPPDPASLTADLRDLEWFNAVRLDLSRVSVDAVIADLRDQAGLDDLQGEQIESRFKATLQSYEGSHRTTYDFRLARRSRDGKSGLEIALVRD